VNSNAVVAVFYSDPAIAGNAWDNALINYSNQYWDAVVYHYKPPLGPGQFARVARQARAQARTAIQFLDKHPHWRIALATGQIAPALLWSQVAKRSGWPALLEKIAQPEQEHGTWPLGVRRWAAARLARSAYYDELTRGRRQA
jgi:hypothetical protein